MTPDTELPIILYVGIGPLQLGVVIVFIFSVFHTHYLSRTFDEANKYVFFSQNE